MNVLGTVLAIFLLLFVGYGMKKIHLLRAEDADVLNTLVVYITLPAYIFEAIYGYKQPLSPALVRVPFIGFGMIAVVLAIAYVIGRMLKVERRVLGGLIIASGFGNTGFLGYPVVQAAFHDKGALVTAALYDEIAMAVPLYTLGALIVAGFAGERVNGKQLARVFAMPSLWAIPAALLLRPVALPAPLISAVGFLAGGTVPLVMISLGLSLSTKSLKGYVPPLLAACVLKLGVLPLITHYASVSGGLTGYMYQATVLESAMPSAMMNAVIASKFGADARFVSGVIFVSTLLSIITIPATLLILNGH